MERALYITKYRNIGITKPQRLVLNNYTDKNNIGNLVILVGPCNSGKSNVLSALDCFGKKNFDGSKDINYNALEESNRKPQLSLSCKDESEYTYRFSYGSSKPDIYCGAGNKSFLKERKDLNSLVEFLDYLLVQAQLITKHNGYRMEYGIIPGIQAFRLSVAKGAMSDTPTNMEYCRSQLYDYLSAMHNSGDIVYEEILKRLLAEEKYKHFVETSLTNGATDLDLLYNSYEKKYNMRFMPQIIRYADEPINNNNTYSGRERFAENKFLKSVFELINYPINNLIQAYSIFTAKGMKGILNKEKEIINGKLAKVADDFNRMYSTGKSQYKFEIDLETDKVYFNISNDKLPVSLDNQSAGFRWFFNLYFNLLSKKSLERGDIIIMDEPATNLHVMGQRELRKFLKQFAIDNGITIVLATHVPFLVDIENLDELRVLSVKDGELIISNDFSAINLDDPDSLLPIKQALTAESFHLYDPERTVVFVEGITDSNYMFAFKKILGIEDDIIFLPIHGVGGGTGDNRKKKQIAISKRLIEMRKHNPILLVDGDDAGTSMKAVNERNSSLTVVELSDIDPSFRTIESLFAKADLSKYGLINADGSYNKHASLSALIKTHCDKFEFSEKTKSNFKKLFDKLAKLN